MLSFHLHNYLLFSILQIKTLPANRENGPSTLSSRRVEHLWLCLELLLPLPLLLLREPHLLLGLLPLHPLPLLPLPDLVFRHRLLGDLAGEEADPRLDLAGGRGLGGRGLLGLLDAERGVRVSWKIKTFRFYFCPRKQRDYEWMLIQRARWGIAWFMHRKQSVTERGLIAIIRFHFRSIALPLTNNLMQLW